MPSEMSRLCVGRAAIKTFSFVAVGLVSCLQIAVAQPALVELETHVFVETDEPIPTFKVDASWPNMPESMLIGQVPGLSVDKSDNLWLIHRPNSLSSTDLALEQNPPTGVCCKAAPHVMKFSPKGELLTAWGGPDIAPTIDGVNQWPGTVHGIYVDDENTVWLAGNGEGDHVVLNFTDKGKFIKSYGKRGQSAGNMDPATLGNPADIFHDTVNNTVVIADGYTNKRVISFDTESDNFNQLWGAYGKPPGGGTREGAFDTSMATAAQKDAGADAENFGDIVHCVTKSKDGFYYVCDRRNNRVQVFKAGDDGKFKFVKQIVIAENTGGTGTATDIAFSPDEKYLYVADMMNDRIWILLKETDQVLASVGRSGRYAGQFTWLHSIVTDSEGNIYTSEVSTGRRVQKLVFTGNK